jgi:hypothetical protein
MADLQREWGNSVQHLKKQTQVPPIPTALFISFPCWQFVSELPIAVPGGAESLKGSHMQDRGQVDFSLDRTFK